MEEGRSTSKHIQDSKAEIELIGNGEQQIELYFEVEYIEEIYKKLKDHQIMTYLNSLGDKEYLEYMIQINILLN